MHLCPASLWRRRPLGQMPRSVCRAATPRVRRAPRSECPDPCTPHTHRRLSASRPPPRGRAAYRRPNPGDARALGRYGTIVLGSVPALVRGLQKWGAACPHATDYACGGDVPHCSTHARTHALPRLPLSHVRGTSFSACGPLAGRQAKRGFACVVTSLSTLACVEQAGDAGRWMCTWGEARRPTTHEICSVFLTVA